MALRFPIENQTAYGGQIKFTVVQGGAADKQTFGETCDLYLPVGVQIQDGIEYENMGLGFAGELAQGEGTNLTDGDLGGAGNVALGKFLAKFNDRAGAAARNRTKTAPNPNTRALFKQVNLRQFQFTFKLIPTSASEANAVPEIIKFFRANMYPEDIIVGGVPGGYKFPNRFKIEISHDNNPNIATKISECYMNTFTTNYNPTNGAFVSEGGKAYQSETDISMTLTEADTLTYQQILEGF